MTSPNLHGNSKMKKHVAHGGRAHTRDPSIKSIHKQYGDTHADSGTRKPVRNNSTVNLKKNNSNVNLKRNRSSAEVKPKFTVAFEIGEQEDGWEETSSSASPAVSREHSRTGSKTKCNETKLPVQSRSQDTNEILRQTSVSKHITHAKGVNSKGITERLISRPQSQHTTHMSLATVTNSAVVCNSSPSSPTKDTSSNTEEASHLVDNSGTSSGLSNFLFHNNALLKTSDDVKRAHSMKNLTNHQSDEEETSALRSRKLSAGQSRTQQKLWLQRASSIIEPDQVTTHYGNEIGFFMGSTYEGRNPRIKNLLGRTGMEYLVVRRYQDPISNSLKRINQLPDMERSRRIIRNTQKPLDGSSNVSNGARLSSSQNSKGCNQIKNTTSSTVAPLGPKTVRSSSHDGSNSTRGLINGNVTKNEAKNCRVSYNESQEIAVILRRLWDKSPDLSAGGD